MQGFIEAGLIDAALNRGVREVGSSILPVPLSECACPQYRHGQDNGCKSVVVGQLAV